MRTAARICGVHGCVRPSLSCFVGGDEEAEAEVGAVAEGEGALHGSGELDAEGAGEARAAVIAGLGTGRG